MYRCKIVNTTENLSKQTKYIDITLEIENLFGNKIAAASIKEMQGIKIDPSKKVFYEDFLTTVENLIYQKFTILSSKQSNKSYSWYIDFETTDTHWTVRIKISNHDRDEDSENYTSANKNNKSRSIFRSILIGENKEFKTPFAALTALDEIIEGISNGDLNVIYTDYKDKYFEESEIQNTLDKLHVDRQFKLK